MGPDRKSDARSWALARLERITRRTAAVALKPLSDAAEVAFRVGMGLERRAVEPVLDSPEVARLLSAAVGDQRLHAAVRRVLASEGAKQVVASFFESGLFDEFVDRLLASEGLQRLVDEIAASQAVTDAITQQSLGFIDQMGDEVRHRSRDADDWLERSARRLTHRRSDPPPRHGTEPDAGAA